MLEFNDIDVESAITIFLSNKKQIKNNKLYILHNNVWKTIHRTTKLDDVGIQLRNETATDLTRLIEILKISYGLRIKPRSLGIIVAMSDG